ncbi:anthranilate phosphoribosyltransferase [Nonomuraea candida]|uniref:anthranilate phosphoribosyltransferase n=1 Tax=Nonomuraea candida TaxID=359159 RepID=UPI000693A983|nr:anthranilate phosphoribosyltransferase [Nonomuraea candida]
MLAALRRLSLGEELTEEEASAALYAIMRGEASPVQIGGLVMGLAAKGVSPSEVVSMARAVMEFSAPFSGGSRVLDTCGTGGDGHNTFNVSTVVAIVAAACGQRVAKHGSRSVSSQCGSADVLEALGVRTDLQPAQAARCLELAGIVFLSATVFHPAFRHAMGPIKELGVRTVFNLLGPLCSPALARYRILGVPDAALVSLLSEVLMELGVERALVFSSQDGLDELSISAPAQVVEVRDGSLHPYLLDPARLGLAPAGLRELEGGPPGPSAELVRGLLAGERGPRRDMVLLNTAAALRAAGRCEDWGEGMALAAGAIDSGRAAATLDRWIQVSQAVASS